MLVAVKAMSTSGIGSYKLWNGDVGDTADQRAKYTLINLAAFLAQSMKETIMYDACDENNWSNAATPTRPGGPSYALDAACGQLGQVYSNYTCSGEDAGAECPQLPNAKITAVTHAKWYGAPGPLFCAPDSALAAAGKFVNGGTGYWNYGADAWPYPATQPNFVLRSDLQAWERPDNEVYVGQKAGKFVFDGSGRSVQGCAWWGRGVIQTTGRCNFGLLNKYVGAGNSNNLYPNNNFCQDPESVCSDTAHPELKWIAGFFYWMKSVQDFTDSANGNWNYKASLKAFVNGGFTSRDFIDRVSGVVNRGCASATSCPSGAVDGLAERYNNFKIVLKAMNLPTGF
jgi:predicted chitinase